MIQKILMRMNMKKTSRLPPHLKSVKKICPACGRKQLMQHKFEKNKWKCQGQGCRYVIIKDDKSTLRKIS
jgi:hypothetical protein